jgi:hypothetical protein
VTAGEVDFMANQISINGAVTAGLASFRPDDYLRPITVGANTCQISPCLTLGDLSRVNAPVIGIGQSDYGSAGSIHVAGITVGTGTATDRHANTTTIGLLGASSVTQSGAIIVAELAIEGAGEVNLTHSGNAVQFLAGQTYGDFRFVNSHGFSVTDMIGSDFDYAIYGVDSSGGAIALTALTGDMRIASDVDAWGGDITLAAGGSVFTDNEALVSGDHLSVSAGAAIQLETEVNSLSATSSSGADPIVITNYRPLNLLNVTQSGTGTGIISIGSIGELSVLAGHAVFSDAGAITLVAHSPLNVYGTVHSNTGTIELEAAASGSAFDNLTITGSVITQSSVTLTAGGEIYDGGNVTGSTITKIQNVNTTPTTTIIVTNPVTYPMDPDLVLEDILATTIAAASPDLYSLPEETGSEDDAQDENTEVNAQNDGASNDETAQKMYCN